MNKASGPNDIIDVLALGSALVELTPTTPGHNLVQANMYEALPSGATANFCVALAKLGVKVSLASCVGEDELGQWLRQRLQELGVDTSLIRVVPGQLTPVSFCWMDGNGAKTFYFYRCAGFCDPMQELVQQPLTDTELRRARWLDFSEATIRAEPLRSVSLNTARRARALGLQVAYAMNYRASQWHEPREQIIAVQRQALALADIAVMNVEEAYLVAEEPEASAAAETPGLASALPLEKLRQLGPRLIAVTAGNQGVTLISPQEQKHIPALPVSVQYDIGAGDTFHAGFIAALLKGYDPPAAACIGSAAAALRISRPPDMRGLPTWEEALAAARQYPHLQEASEGNKA